MLELDDEPESIIMEDFEENFHCYSVFSLLFVARKFDLPYLQDQCLQELILEDFEQLNYNKYEFSNATSKLSNLSLGSMSTRNCSAVSEESHKKTC